MYDNDCISIIVPVYGVEDYLDDCVESLIAQTYEEIEILLVDDGSTDGSGEICDRWAARDNRIRVIHQENKGLSGARNVGIEASTGSYIAFVDSDDTVTEDYIEKLYRAVSDLDVPCVVCGYENNGIDGFTSLYRPTVSPEVITARECFERNLMVKPQRVAVSVVVWCKLYHRDLFKEGLTYFPEGEVYEDLGSMFAIIERCKRIGLIPDVLYRKHQREDSITGTHSIRNSLDYERAMYRFYGSVKDRYPDLEDAANRCMERGRIATLMNLLCTLDEGKESGVQDEIERVLRDALEYRSDLLWPDDATQMVKLWLIHWAPAVVLPAKNVWRRFRQRKMLKRNTT